ncbi:hypothetical protein SAMN05443429_11233 [Cruoricaptor ignavus]|uniref:Uncharacterized protein n=1 Tax=Cruoricaptor ignavus TaxID=1118202 RepID=A0A1M6HE79_9FLAO|nr:hypothetical protein [Cruoricaptor ignavus]SHJ20495.1 hypothetical protein SAMN05443429_11233 [Cruoricaptor ignavus]
MITQIWVNGRPLDLYQDSDIKYTMQVNDIAELKDRQASYTNAFSVPKTDKNIQILDGLGIPSDTSQIPYEKPFAQMKIDGYDLITKGWLNISEVSESFRIYIYSGIINFFKAISNKTLRELSDSSGNWLGVFNHKKNLTAIINSQSSEYYRYLIADFGGKTLYQGAINIDYLIPFMRCRYIFDKIHESVGFTYSGSIVDDDRFNRLWMSYPKFSDVYAESKDVFTGNSNRFVAYSSYPVFSPLPRSAYYFIDFADGYRVENAEVTPYGKLTIYKKEEGWITVKEAGRYKISVEGSIKKPSSMSYEFKYSVNQKGRKANEAHKAGEVIIKASGNSEINFQKSIMLNAGDSIAFTLFASYRNEITAVLDCELSIKVTKVPDENIDVTEAIGDMKATDFIKEIYNRFGLTAYPDEFSENLHYVKVDERLNPKTAKDWSDKYIRRKTETFVYDDYAQLNSFEYKYTEEGQSHYDGVIPVNNKNLNDSKTAYKSFSFAAESYTSDLASLPVLKMYNQEVKEDKDGNTHIEYKGASNRYYFVESNAYSGTLELISEATKEKRTATELHSARFIGYQEVINNYYPDMKRVIDEARIHTIELNLFPADALLLDLYSAYYFSQEQQYYILNKLNYSESEASAEFIRLNDYQQWQKEI